MTEQTYKSLTARIREIAVGGFILVTGLEALSARAMASRLGNQSKPKRKYVSRREGGKIRLERKK